MRIDLLSAAITFVVVASLIALCYWYFRRIRAGRADPYVNPSWPSVMRPPPTEFGSPHRDDKETSLDEESGKA